MEKVLVIFGSKTDAPVYKEIKHQLRKLKVPFDMRVSSAHKTPDDVQETIAKDYRVVIAGAGLAAHLPGVAAALTPLRPVIGVPCEGNFKGLDALLAVIQMPPGVPVLAVGVNQGAVAAEMAARMMKRPAKVVLVGDRNNKAFERTSETLKKYSVPFSNENEPVDDAINIVFTRFDEPVAEHDKLIIYCPLMEDVNMPEAALSLLKHTNHGLWVGVNNGKNAAIAAIEILNLDDAYTSKLQKHRGSMKAVIEEANTAEESEK